MRKIIIIVVLLIVLAGGGAGGYLYFSKSAQAANTAEVKDAAVLAAEEAKAKKHAAIEADEKSEYVQLDPLILPIIDRGGVEQIISIVVSMQVPDTVAAGQVKKMAPKLKDAFIRDMYGMLNRYAALKNGVVQVGAIKERLNKITIDMMGEDKVREVLLQVVQQRQI